VARIRIRSIKPELFSSPQVMNLTVPARFLFVGLICHADDEGRGSADLRRIKAAVFPGDESLSLEQLGRWLAELVREDLAIVYLSEKHGHLYCLPSFNSHQYIQKPKPSGYPGPSQSGNGNVQVTYTNDTCIVGSEGSEGSDPKDRDRIRSDKNAAAPAPALRGAQAAPRKTFEQEFRQRFGCDPP